MKRKDAYNQDEFVHDVLDFLVAYYKEIERLNNIINKAIEYINRELLQEHVEYYKNNKYNVTISGKDIMAYEIIDLLDILKGDQ